MLLGRAAPDYRPRVPTTRLGRAAIGVGALLFVLANAITVLTPASVHLGGENGLVRALDEVFLTGHMFASSLPVNTDVVIEGRRSDGSWERLDARALFALDVPGDRVARLFAARARFLHGERGQREAWTDLARRIVDHQRLAHPDAPIDAVRFGIEQWPKDPAGYEARRRPGETTLQLWYAWEAP